MNSKPILFNEHMITALLSMRKKQTRRIAAPDIQEAASWYEGDEPTAKFIFGKSKDDNGNIQGPEWLVYSSDYPEEGVTPIGQCPFGNVGDYLWVREAFAKKIIRDYEAELERTAICYKQNPRIGVRFPGVIKNIEKMCYLDQSTPLKHHAFGDLIKYKPSIHMPWWASRITLEIKNIRIERLKEISETGALLEGVEPLSCQPGWTELIDTADPKELFAGLWESINGPGSWNKNPWVWVIDFEPIFKNINEIQQEAQS